MPNVHQQSIGDKAATAAQVDVRLYAAEGKTRVQRKKLIDKAAGVCITAGGVAIILSILAILFVIVAETLPLWKTPTAGARKPLDLRATTGNSATPLRLGT